METGRNRLPWNKAKLSSRFHTVILVCLVAVLSYLAPKLAAALLLHPQTVWPLWPVCALLISVLLLVPRRIWPFVIPAAFAAIVLYDLQEGMPIRSIAWFIPADTVEVLIAAFGLSYFFDGVPRLNSVKALSKYLLFAVLLAPFAAAFLSALGIRGDYWTSWRICFFSEVLASVTLTPAIWGWVTNGPAWVRKSRASHLEFAGLMAVLVLLSYIAFTAAESSSSPALLYSLVPFLLWAALRFGSMGASSSVLVVAFLSIWGAVHGRGPFTDGGLFRSVFSLQLFLVFTAIPFMVLAALVEERKRGEDVLREGEERLRLAMEAGKLGGWEWDIKSGRNPWFGEAQALLGMKPATRSGSVQDFWDRVHPEDRGPLRMAIETAKQNHEEFDQEFRVVWPDGTLHWLRSQGRFFYAPHGEPERMLGISKDITVQKQVERALRRSEAELIEAQRLAKVGSWRWDPTTDTVTWSEELYRIAGIDPGTPAVSFKDHHRLYTPESWERLRAAVEEALRTGTPYELDLEMIRSDGARRWLVARGEAHRDASGDVVQLRGTVHDITERKRTEEALRESEERLHLAVQAGGMYAYEWDPLTDKVTRSANCINILGKDEPLHTTREELSARVHPDDREQMAANPSQLTPEHPNSHMTYRVLRHDGTVIWLEKSGRAFFDGQGRMLRMIGLVVDITERKRAEQALRESEERLHLAVRAGGMYAFEWDMLTDVIVRTGECADIFNWMDDPTCVTGRQFVDKIHPDDREAYAVLRTRLTPEKPTYKTSYRVLRPDGSVIWLEANGRVFFDGQGRMLRIMGMVADVTERKLAEEVLSSVSRRLIEAQDQERSRIARELHDDLSQRMALLQIGFDQFVQDAAGLSFQARQQLHNIAKVAAEISADIHSLSHRLHPSKLDNLSLVLSLEGLCREFSGQHHLQVQFVHHDIQRQVPKDVTLCLFRIAQEALQNVVKHSEAAEAKVELSGHDDRIELCISDSGVGFNPESVGGDTLGLVSMRERVRLVEGRLAVESEPSRGTRIFVRVPFLKSKLQTRGNGNAAAAG